MNINRIPTYPSQKKNTFGQIASFSLVLLAVFSVRSSVVEAYKIPSGSMIPTILIGDQIFVDKSAYGAMIPLTDWKALSDKPRYLFRTKNPARGDIIVFRYPVHPEIFFIKRVIGLPGDVIEMKNKVVTVNGKAPEQSESSSEMFESNQMTVSHQKFDHTVGTTMINPLSQTSENFGPITVPQDQYFCMGDNRDNSLDSRYWGFVPFENIMGRAVVVWFSLEADFQQKQFAFHPERIGTILH